jgi:hypothetical protein
VLRITLPYSGHLLVGHLAAFGLAVALDDAGYDAFVDHDPGSVSFEPRVTTDALSDQVSAAVRQTAVRAESTVEADAEPGQKGNARRSVIWARASFANEVERSRQMLTAREILATQAESAGDRTTSALLAGLGASAAWGLATADGRPKPAHGATELDGVIGNIGSDLVRGVIRPARNAASDANGTTTVDRWTGATADEQADKTGWAPAGTQVSFIDQWLAVLGLALLPVAHRGLARSETPACWNARALKRQGITLPVLGAPTSLPRLRTILREPALADGEAATAALSEGEGPVTGYAPLRRRGVAEVVVFPRTYAEGAGSSVAFTFDRGTWVAVP